VVICLHRGAGCLRMVQLMPLHPETPSCLASFKSKLVLPFWYRLTQVVLEKRPLNGCSRTTETTGFSLRTVCLVITCNYFYLVLLSFAYLLPRCTSHKDIERRRAQVNPLCSHLRNIYAQQFHSRVSVCVCICVCMSQVGVLLKHADRAAFGIEAFFRPVLIGVIKIRVSTT